MAIIQCPECGQQISDKARQCIHCGCKFTVCKECGNVTVGETQTCPICGYSPRSVAEIKKVQETNETTVKLKDVYNSKSEPFKKNSLTISTVILTIGAVICIVIALKKLSSWAGSTSSDIVSEYKSMLSSAKTFFIIGFIVGTISTVFQYLKDVLFAKDFQFWANGKKIQPNAMISEAITADISKLPIEEQKKYLTSLNQIVFAVDYNKDYKRKQATTMNIVLLTLLSIASTLLSLWCLLENLDAISQKIFWFGDKYEFEFDHLVNLWAIVVGIIIDWIVNIIKKSQKKADLRKNEAWVKANLPDVYPKYIALQDSIQVRKKSNF